jgi:hypothetical protein
LHHQGLQRGNHRLQAIALHAGQGANLLLVVRIVDRGQAPAKIEQRRSAVARRIAHCVAPINRPLAGRQRERAASAAEELLEPCERFVIARE